MSSDLVKELIHANETGEYNSTLFYRAAERLAFEERQPKPEIPIVWELIVKTKGAGYVWELRCRNFPDIKIVAPSANTDEIDTIDEGMEFANEQSYAVVNLSETTPPLPGDQK